MSRLLVVCAALALASPARADEVEVKRAYVSAASLAGVRRIEVAPSDLHNVVVRPWARPDAQLVASKSAADETALDVMRVEVTIVGDEMSLRLGERRDGAWSPLRPGSRIDLVVDVPARLTGAPPHPRPAPPDDGWHDSQRLRCSRSTAWESEEPHALPSRLVRRLRLRVGRRDFHAHHPPARVRAVRMGHVVAADGAKRYVLCGELLPAPGARDAAWTPFVTVQTSGYEQYVGAAATSFCRPPIIWDDRADLSPSLQSQLDSLR